MVAKLKSNQSLSPKLMWMNNSSMSVRFKGSC